MLFCYKNCIFTVISFIVLCIGFISSATAEIANVTSGQFIQKIHTDTLLQTADFTVNDFFSDDALADRVRADILADVVMGPPPLSTNIFSYALHSPDFVDSHPNRNPGINSFPSNFSFNPNDFMGTASGGRIGLGGVMRFDLPPGQDGRSRFFIAGDWTIEFDKKRIEKFNFDKDPKKPIEPKEFGVSGWFMRNHFDFPFISFDMLNTTTFTNSDSFYLAGELGWSPEFTTTFLPDETLYKAVSDFILCGQDDDKFSRNPAKQIPCVFPNITVNGKTGTVNVSPPEMINLSVDLGVASNNSHPNADYFAAFVYQGTFYWLNKNFEWTTSAGPAYQGALLDFRSIAIPAPKLPSGALPSGATIPVYFGVDSTQNAIFDEPYRFSQVTLQIN